MSVVPTDDDRVFVFGAAFTGIYLHGFRASDGKSLVRISSNCALPIGQLPTRRVGRKTAPSAANRTVVGRME